MEKTVKLYRVTFLSYTNCSRDTVSNENGDYLHVPNGELIIKEDQMDYFRKFGNGFDSVKYVGEMYESLWEK